jgi:hypothetical protein
LEKRGVWITTEVSKELKNLNTELEAADKVVAQGSNKAFKISAVIKARKKLIAKDPEWVAKRQAKIRAENGDGDESPVESFEARVERELDTPFFSFHGTTARSAYAEKRYSFAAAVAAATTASAAMPSPNPSPAQVRMSQTSHATLQSSQSTGEFAGLGFHSLR